VLYEQWPLGKSFPRSRLDQPHWPDPQLWPMTLTFNPLQGKAMTYSRAKVQGQWSLGSEYRVETDGQEMEGRRRFHYLPHYCGRVIRQCVKWQSPLARQAFPECSASIRANGGNPRVWRTTQFGANTDVCIETKAEEKGTQQHRVIFTVLENSIDTCAYTHTNSNILIIAKCIYKPFRNISI